MSELPPDAPRLRAILAHLDQQAADNEAVGIYLRLQRDKVRAALARAETKEQRQPARRRRRPAPTQLPTYAQAGQPTRYKVVQRETDEGAVFVSLHLGDCDIDKGETQWLNAHEAMVALSDGIAGCVFCRPYDVLGFSQD